MSDRPTPYATERYACLYTSHARNLVAYSPAKTYRGRGAVHIRNHHHHTILEPLTFGWFFFFVRRRYMKARVFTSGVLSLKVERE